MSARERDPAERIAGRLAGCGLAHVAVFASPEADLAALCARLSARLGAPVSGCTTAGEIGERGYVEGNIVAIGFPSARFAARSLLIEGLGEIDAGALARRVAAERVALAAGEAARTDGFALLMVDGLARREDSLVAALAPGLGTMPLVGGSAGDGARFERTLVALDGSCREDAAVLTLIRTDLRVEAFSIAHVRPTQTRMVVTCADPASRLVRRINGAPAAAELARLIGLPPGPPGEFDFAGHPTVVRIGSRTHVRSISRATPEGHLSFFSAIDEGLVLTLARPGDIVSHLGAALARLTEGRPVAGIIGCDCILRRIEAEQRQATREVSEILARHRVRGFSTYGEQMGAMHLNNTMTGVALFAEPASPPGGTR